MVLTADPRPRSARAVVAPSGRKDSVLWRLDWLLLAVVAALVALGTLLVWSATARRSDLTGGVPTAFATKQLLNVAIGVLLAVVVASTDHRWVRIWTPLVYLGSLAGLVAVLVPGVGQVINGSQSWLSAGGLSLQPSELAKLAVIAAIALLVAEKSEGSKAGDKVRDVDVVQALVLAAIPAALILMQPDLGTLMVLGAVTFGVVALAGAPRRWLVGLLVMAVGGAVLAVKLHALAGYQLDRFAAFTNPGLDPQGAGYNTTQARIAIGNGGLFGQGLFDGSQTQSGFVPAQHTDFVFTVAGEELGLVGAGAIIVAFGLLLLRALRIAAHAQDMFGRVAAGGIACWFGFQAFQNIGMCLGIMPVTGVPLPLVSYGGTSMFAALMAVGLLQNIHLRTDHSFVLGAAVRSRVARSRW